MRQGTYLNVVLTINAVLLAGVLWTQCIGTAAQQPVLENAAVAQTPPDAGIPNAAAQRQKMIEGLRDIKTSTDAIRKLLEGGKLRVEVTNPSKN